MPSSRAPRRQRDRRPSGLDERQRRARAAEAAAAQASREVLDRAAVRRDDTWREAVRENRRRSIAVVAWPCLIGVVIALLGVLTLPLLVVGLVILVAWVVVAGLAWRRAMLGPGARLGGSSLDEAVRTGVLTPLAAERYRDVTESLCAALGVEVPRLSVLVEAAPNAIATGARPDAVQLTLTTGLLAGLDRIELEAVLAHELAHVKRLDTLSGGLSASLLRGGALPLPGAAKVAQWLEGPFRELEADLAAVQATRYPPGLVSALESIGAARSEGPETGVGAELRRSTGRQWIVPLDRLAVTESAAARPADRELSLSDRLEVLVEL